MNAVTGIVSTHAHIIWPTTPHFTALSRFVAPTPMIDAEMTCVVERGMPRWLAIWMIAAAVVADVAVASDHRPVLVRFE